MAGPQGGPPGAGAVMLRVSLRHRVPDLEVDFEAPGGITALFGPSGAGKTSVLRAVAGLLTPERGRIEAGALLFDHSARVNLPPHRRRIGYVFQEPRLFPHLSVAQNLRYGARYAVPGTTPSEARLVELLGLGPLMARGIAGLSGGEAQRVAIGRAILSGARLLALDEPMAALDAPRRAEIMAYLEALRDETALPMLLVSHALEEVIRLASTLVLMEGGRVRRAGPLAELLADPALVPVFGVREAGALLDVVVTGCDPDGLTRVQAKAGPLWLPQTAAVGAALRLRVRAADVTLAVARPDGLSALNILPATVTRVLTDAEGPGGTVLLDCAGAALMARVTARSVAALDLVPGREVWAVIKALSVAA